MPPGSKNLGPINHKESYLAGPFFLLVNDPKRETDADEQPLPIPPPSTTHGFLSLWMCLLRTLGADRIMQPMTFVSGLFQHRVFKGHLWLRAHVHRGDVANPGDCVHPRSCCVEPHLRAVRPGARACSSWGVSS